MPENILENYNPTFYEPIKGSWHDNTNFISLNFASGGFATEREMNETQWTHIDTLAKYIRRVTESGILTVDEDGLGCFKIINNDEHHLNGFEMPEFYSVLDGYINRHLQSINGVEGNISVRLPNPPVADTRNDFVFLEFWLQEVKDGDKIPKYGYIVNDHMSNISLIDERVTKETARRVQLQWTISHYEDYDLECDNGFITPDGTPNQKIHPRMQTGLRNTQYYFKPSEHDSCLFMAGEEGSNLNTVDGFVYAIPMFVIQRLNNSGFDETLNVFGAIDYVDETSVSDRADGKFANIIYDDQIKDLRHMACIGEEQFTKYYVTMSQFLLWEKALRKKIERLTSDVKNADNMLRNLGYSLPDIHDKDIYGIEMYGQDFLTGGAMINDALDKDKKVVYRRKKLYVGDKLKGCEYTSIPTLIDYDWDNKGKLGDIFVEYLEDKIYVRNTGSKGLRMHMETILIDNENTVWSGIGTFTGLDGTIIQMPITSTMEQLNPNRYFISIVPIDDSNGRNGEIFVRMLETNEIVVYNTGVTSTTSDVIDSSGGTFRWTLIDLYSNSWKNMSYVNVELNGQAGVSVSSQEFGENYRVTLGTPILPADAPIDEGSVGEVFIDRDLEDMFMVYNTGSTGAICQTLILNDIPYKEYFDTLELVGSEYINIPTVVIGG